MKRNKSYTYQKMAKDIRDRLNGRPYSMGLDLGVGSIGVACVALEDFGEAGLIPSDIVYAASRIFNPSSGSADRRLFRGQRNSIRHSAHRKEKLWKILAERGLMLPYAKGDTENKPELMFSEESRRKDVWQLRLKGLSEELSLADLGMAIYHISSHRGSSSIRTFTEEEKKEAANQRITEKIAKEIGKDTFIEIITSYNDKNISNGIPAKYRNTKIEKNDAELPLPTRDVIENELNKLLETQRKFHGELDDEYISRIKEAVLYENPKIVPEPENCPYFKDEKKLPKANFLNEERRLWEALNNARVVTEEEMPDGRFKTIKTELTKAQKDILYKELREGNDITQTKARKLLPELVSSNFVFQGTKKEETKIQGFRYKALEEKAFWQRLNDKERDKFILTWVNTADDKILRKALINEFRLTEDEADELMRDSSISIPTGTYADVGKTAMEMILQYIINEGMSYQEAELEAIRNGSLPDDAKIQMFDFLPYYGEAIPNSTKKIMGKAWHSAFESQLDSPGFKKPNTDSEEEIWGKIANPVVHQTLNELRKLVNEIIEIFGYKPEEIIVEFGRELKKGAEEREKLSMENKKKENNNKRIFETYCKPNGLSEKFIKRFKIWEDCGMRCPYCCKPISATEIVNGDADLDHIFPIEDTADSSENNLIVAHRTCNERKGKRIPIAAFGKDPLLWNKIEQNLDSTPGLAVRKHRFETTEEEYEEYLSNRDFDSRFKSDNAFVAKAAKQYLGTLYDPEIRDVLVRTIRGAETGLLRTAWNLNGISEELASLHTLPGDEVEYTEKKNRTDNRHHALDAIVAAYSTRSVIKMINTYSGKGRNAYELSRRIPIPRYYKETGSELSKTEQKDEFRRYLSDFIFYKTYVSRKIDNDRNGELLKATQYSVLFEHGDDLVFANKKKLSTSSFSTFTGSNSSALESITNKFKVPVWLSDEEKATIEKMLRHNESAFKAALEAREEAKTELEEENKKKILEGKKPMTLSEKLILRRVLENIGGFYWSLTNNTRGKVFVKKRFGENSKSSAFDTGSNFSLDIYKNEKGELKGEIIRKVQAMDKNYIPNYKKQGFKLIERIHQGDILEIDQSIISPTSKKGDYARNAHNPNAPAMKTFIKVDTFTEQGKNIVVFISNILKSTGSQDGWFMFSNMQKLDIRKINLSPAGLVTYRSKVIGS